MNLNAEEKVYVSPCMCVLDGTVFWFFFGGGLVFQTFIYLTLVFHVCVCIYIYMIYIYIYIYITYIYIKYISHFSVPDSRPMILVTSATPQATYPGEAERGQAGFWG